MFKLTEKKLDNWNCQIDVLNTNGEIVYGVKRNYGSNNAGIVEHEGKFYFVGNKNYHGGFIIYNLTDKLLLVDYIPAHNVGKYIPYWCLAAVKQSPNKKHVLLSGCYWGAPYDDVLVKTEDLFKGDFWNGDLGSMCKYEIDYYQDIPETHYFDNAEISFKSHETTVIAINIIDRESDEEKIIYKEIL